MTYSDLLYQLKQWESQKPELLEQKAYFMDSPEDGAIAIEIDNIELTTFDTHPEVMANVNLDSDSEECLILTP